MQKLPTFRPPPRRYRFPHCCEKLRTAHETESEAGGGSNENRYVNGKKACLEGSLNNGISQRMNALLHNESQHIYPNFSNCVKHKKSKRRGGSVDNNNNKLWQEKERAYLTPGLLE